MPFHFYIIYSPTKDRFYIGHTGDELCERLRRHNSNHKGFTGIPADWKFVYTEAHDTKAAAYAREREVKAWKSRQRIEALARSVHSA